MKLAKENMEAADTELSREIETEPKKMSADVRIPHGFRQLKIREKIQIGDYCVQARPDHLRPCLEWQRWDLHVGELFVVRRGEIFIRMNAARKKER